MKYYVCSPMGRTGSKRIVNGIHRTLGEHNKELKRMYISFEGVYRKDNMYYQGFQLLTFNGFEVTGESYDNEAAIALMNDWETPIVLHSHNTNLLPSVSEDWKFILSSRKRKIDVILSILMLEKTGSSGPHDPISDKFKRFRADPNRIEKYMEAFIKRENNFINNVIALTGKPPITIYLEDTWQMVQQKAGAQFYESATPENTNTISSHKAEDYITNYNAIQKRYDNNLNYYKNQFMTDTY